MKGTIYIKGAIGNEVNLVDVVSQVNKFKNLTELEVHIDSPGGGVDAGFDIYYYLKSLNMPITTIGGNWVMSIATVIFMAGNKRVLSKNTDFMIHLPWGQIQGTAEEILSYHDMVLDAENRLVNFYTTDLSFTKEAIYPLLKEETRLTNEQAIALGFATSVVEPVKAIAFFEKEFKNPKNMNVEQSKFLESWFRKIENLILKKPQNIILQDATGVDIEFYELEEGQTPKLGDMAKVGGVPANGDYIMPNGDTYAFESGKLTEIAPKEAEQMEQELENLRTQVADLKAENEEKENRISAILKEVTALKSAVVSNGFKADPKEPQNKKDEAGEQMTPAQLALKALKNKK